MWHGPWEAEMTLQVGCYIFQALGPCQVQNLGNGRLQATVYSTFAKKKVQIVQKKYKKMLATLITKD
jgi:hypothetical protein